jgi:hypothetical protein
MYNKTVGKRGARGCEAHDVKNIFTKKVPRIIKLNHVNDN